MATMCENCFEVDNRKYKHGRMCKRCNGLLVQVDEMLLPTIALLNKKGYRTQFCCSGHVYDTAPEPHLFFETYIYFAPNVNIDILPEGFLRNDNCYDNGFIICKPIGDWSDIDTHAELLRRNPTLIEWARELPQHNESNIL